MQIIEPEHIRPAPDATPPTVTVSFTLLPEQTLAQIRVDMTLQSDTVTMAIEVTRGVFRPENSSHANAYLQVGDSPRALVVLAFAEQGELKWASADKNMFVTHDGRLIKTLGLPTNLRRISAATPDPLSSPVSNRMELSNHSKRNGSIPRHVIRNRRTLFYPARTASCAWAPAC